jgi:urease accessory protein
MACEQDPIGIDPAPHDQLALLRLLQLADSALPVGAAAHSFGLESLIDDGLLTVESLAPFLQDFLEENGALDAYFCRAAYRVSPGGGEEWSNLNRLVSARRLSREIRDASLTLGRRFLRLAAVLLPDHAFPVEMEAHHVTAFGFVARAVGVDERSAVLGWLHQSTAALVSAMQRLAPLGQTRASEILWSLKPVIVRIGNACGDERPPQCFAPLPEIAGMRHPKLVTRLFIS